ncbi:MAG: hypothetical protein M8350_03810 [Methanosarcinaceae archaeon]|nr:hypothetical protein [Methanosarcinaceae archaeon]
MKRDILNDDNAVSISIGFILTFTITVIAFLMIMQTFYGMLYQAEHTVLRAEFEIHGNDIAVQLTNIDTIVNVSLSSGGSIGEIRYEVSLPDKIAGSYYSVEFSNLTSEIIFGSDDRLETIAKIPYVTQTTTVSSTKIYSAAGEHYLLYNPSTNLIEVY